MNLESNLASKNIKKIGKQHCHLLYLPIQLRYTEENIGLNKRNKIQKARAYISV